MDLFNKKKIKELEARLRDLDHFVRGKTIDWLDISLEKEIQALRKSKVNNSEVEFINGKLHALLKYFDLEVYVDMERDLTCPPSKLKMIRVIKIRKK